MDFTIQGVEKFLQEHPGLEFYAFAYDCNAEYAEVNLCFNTAADFEKTLNYYRSGEYAKYYQTEEKIRELKYNTGDWEYQCFQTLRFMTADDLEEIFEQQPETKNKSWGLFLENLMCLFCAAMLDFTKTETFGKIPKTKDFVVYCLDHDESIDRAFERMDSMREIVG